jgi:uncharacterized membrane protein YeiH
VGPIELNLLNIIEFVGVVAFALSAAFAAAGRRLDVAAFCAVAVAAGLGGGTLYDLLIGTPVFWLDHPAALAACLVVAGLVWAVGERSWGARALLWFDAVGLGAVAAAGVARAAEAGKTPLAAAAVGVLAAAVCGLIRDGVVREPPVMLDRALYLAAAAAGVLLFVLLRLLQIDAGAAAAWAAVLTFAVRAGALRFGWALPALSNRD